MSAIKRREAVTAATQVQALDLLLRGISSHLKDICRRSTIVHRRAADGERRNTLNDPELGAYGFLVMTPPPNVLCPSPKRPLTIPQMPSTHLAEQLLDTRRRRGKRKSRLGEKKSPLKVPPLDSMESHWFKRAGVCNCVAQTHTSCLPPLISCSSKRASRSPPTPLAK